MTATHQPGDCIKAECEDRTGESEWMWVRVDSCDDENRIVVGPLDSVPVLDYGEKLKRGSQLAVSHANIGQHRKASEFSNNP